MAEGKKNQPTEVPQILSSAQLLKLAQDKANADKEMKKEQNKKK